MAQKTKRPTTQKPLQKEMTNPSAKYCAMERAQAVLSIWTENRKPSEVCRELQIHYAMLNFWQNRAMEGMLQALEPRVNLEKGPALSPRLQKFLDKRVMAQKKATTNSTKLGERLQKIQSSKLAKNVSSSKK